MTCTIKEERQRQRRPSRTLSVFASTRYETAIVKHVSIGLATCSHRNPFAAMRMTNRTFQPGLSHQRQDIGTPFILLAEPQHAKRFARLNHAGQVVGQ
jgi:hypothetical protein